jgi:hypothetical protein
VVVLANSSPVSPDPYRSRYRLPAAPFAIVATVAAIDWVLRSRSRRVVFAGLAFLAGWRMADGAFEVRREQLLFDDVGRRLLPLVRESDGLVVAVLPEQGALGTSDITAKVTKRWTDEDSLRVLVFPHDQALAMFGPRVACRNADRVELPLKRQDALRMGTVSRLVWMPLERNEPAALEPYCLASRP